MRPILADRLFVIWIAAALTLWCGMLVLLWTVSFDPSGTGPLATLAALMLAIRAASGMPGRAARGIQRLLMAMRLQESLAMELATADSAPAGRRGVRTMMHLLAAGAVFAAIGGLVSTAMVYLIAAPGESPAEGRFLWGPTAWAAIKLAIQFLCMLPMALGISVTFLVTALIRGGSGRDVYASVFREWLTGVAAGLAAVAAAWWLGADILGVALVACVAMGAAAAVLLLRAKLAIRPRRSARPIASGRQRGGQVAIAAGAGAVTVALLVQMRVLRDVACVGLAGRACWAGASVGLLVWFLREADRKSRPAGVAQGLAATIGVLGGSAIQFGLAVRCLAGGAVAIGCGALAVGAQVPLAALGAIVISRQRRLFAIGGGRPRSYLGSVSAGVGAGVLAYLAAGATSAAAAAGLGVCLVGMVAAVVRGISAARRPGGLIRWAVLGAVLICAAGAAPVAAVRDLPAMKAGVWLTTASGLSGRGEEVLPPARTAMLVPRRSQAVTAAAAEVMSAHPGLWWVVAASAADVPAVLPAAVWPWWSHPDPTTSPPTGFLGRGQGDWGDFLHEAAKDPRRFDGALLAPMPADHPDAWQCYAPAVLRRCRRKLHEPAVMVLRTQAGPGAIDDGLAVAGAFEDVLDGGWAVVAIIDGHLDMLLIGAGAAARRPEGGPGAFVVPLERLCPQGTPRGWLGGRGRLLRGRTSPAELRRHLEAVSSAGR